MTAVFGGERAAEKTHAANRARVDETERPAAIFEMVRVGPGSSPSRMIFVSRLDPPRTCRPPAPSMVATPGSRAADSSASLAGSGDACSRSRDRSARIAASRGR